jgi:GNAT superfamily N-acetyltransferase
MQVVYFKRFRMEIVLADAPPPPPLPVGFSWVAWHDDLLDFHAEVKYQSFHDEIDATVFSSLASRPGCSYLMRTIRQKPFFVPQSTWLAVGPGGPAGTVQGLRDRSGTGAVQNLGVVPAYRGLGLGTCLLLKALAGFRATGLSRAYLEVTARNDGAVRLYRRLGFRCRKTIYKAVEVAAAPQTAGAAAVVEPVLL